MESNDQKLESLSDEELRELRRSATKVLDDRDDGIRIYSYEFSQKYVPTRQPKPYVAKLQYSTERGLERIHYYIPKIGKGTYRVQLHGRFEAADFNLIEETWTQLNRSELLTDKWIYIAYRGELYGLNNPVNDKDLIDYLSGNRSVFVPVITENLVGWKRHYAANDPFLIKCGRLLNALQTESKE